MNPELEIGSDDYEELAAVLAEINAEEFDALYAMDAVHAAETFPEMDSDCPW